MGSPDLIDLRHHLAPAHYRSVRRFAAGNDMRLRRIARSGAAYVADLPRVYGAIGATDPTTGSWVSRRLRAIEIQLQYAQLIVRRRELLKRRNTRRNLTTLMMERNGERSLAPPRPRPA